MAELRKARKEMVFLAVLGASISIGVFVSLVVSVAADTVDSLTTTVLEGPVGDTLVLIEYEKDILGELRPGPLYVASGGYEYEERDGDKGALAVEFDALSSSESVSGTLTFGEDAVAQMPVLKYSSDYLYMGLRPGLNAGSGGNVTSMGVIFTGWVSGSLVTWRGSNFSKLWPARRVLGFDFALRDGAGTLNKWTASEVQSCLTSARRIGIWLFDQYSFTNSPAADQVDFLGLGLGCTSYGSARTYIRTGSSEATRAAFANPDTVHLVSVVFTDLGTYSTVQPFWRYMSGEIAFHSAYGGNLGGRPDVWTNAFTGSFPVQNFPDVGGVTSVTMSSAAGVMKPLGIEQYSIESAGDGEGNVAANSYSFTAFTNPVREYSDSRHVPVDGLFTSMWPLSDKPTATTVYDCDKKGLVSSTYGWSGPEIEGCVLEWSRQATIEGVEIDSLSVSRDDGSEHEWSSSVTDLSVETTVDVEGVEELIGEPASERTGLVEMLTSGWAGLGWMATCISGVLSWLIAVMMGRVSDREQTVGIALIGACALFAGFGLMGIVTAATTGMLVGALLVWRAA